MFNHKPKKIGLFCVGPTEIRICLTVGLLISVFTTQRTLAQQKGMPANLNGIQCEHGRAMSMGINFTNIEGGGVSSSAVIDALDQSGVGWTRIFIQWGWIEQKPGVYDWSKIDDEVRIAEKAHTSVLFSIGAPTPCWSLENPQRDCKQPQPQVPKKRDFARFVTAAVSRYKSQVRYWEIWNEPNLAGYLDIPDVEQRLSAYRDQILIPGAEAVHAADPSAKVVAPAFSADALRKGQIGDYTKLVLNGTSAKLVDVVSFHAYFPADVGDKAIEIRNAMGTLGIRNKPIWLTETGLQLYLHGSPGIESRKTDFIDRDILNLLASGNVQRVFWFTMTDSPLHQDTHFGLVDASGPQFKALPAFTELQKLNHSACP